ncbi:MAG: hypothetical protein ACE5JH_00915 [Acidobacteriota bacterium]
MRKMNKAVVAAIVVASLALTSTALMAAPTQGATAASERAASMTVFQQFTQLLAELFGNDTPGNAPAEAPGKTQIRQPSNNGNASEGAIWPGSCRLGCRF